MMVSCLRKCPSTVGKVCNCFALQGEQSPSPLFSPVVANPAGVTIAVRNATIGVSISAIMCLITHGYRRSLSAAIFCRD